MVAGYAKAESRVFLSVSLQKKKYEPSGIQGFTGHMKETKT